MIVDKMEKSLRPVETPMVEYPSKYIIIMLDFTKNICFSSSYLAW